MRSTYFLINWEIIDELMGLSDEELGKLMRAIYVYKKNEALKDNSDEDSNEEVQEVPVFEGALGALFNIIKREL